jgi:hypothetical protein
MYNQDRFIINLGRKATIYGIIGLLCGLISALLLSFSEIAIFFTALFFSFFFTSSFWGVHNLKMWFNKYRYQLPKYIWYFLNIFVYTAGFFLGLIGYGFIDHFLLLLSISQQKDGPGLFGSQIVLLPYLGDLYADKINYNI